MTADTTKTIVTARVLEIDDVLDIAGLRFQIEWIDVIDGNPEKLIQLRLRMIATQNTRNFKFTKQPTTLVVPADHMIQLED